MNRYIIEELATGQWKVTRGGSFIGVAPSAAATGDMIQRNVESRDMILEIQELQARTTLTDLVARLRDTLKYGYPGWHQPCIKVMAEAADRIEELERLDALYAAGIRPEDGGR